MPQNTFMLEVALPGGRTVQVAVTRKRVKNLNLRVRPDGTVAASVPLRTGAERVQAFLDAHAAWIEERARRRAAKQADGIIPLMGEDAGTLPLWGELVDAYRALELGRGTRPGIFGIPSDAAAPSPARRLDALASMDAEDLARRVDACCKREVAAKLPAIARGLEEAMGIRASSWRVRSMKTRWGSCTPATRAIRINARLAAYPIECLEAVVAHELTHLLEPSHNRRFHMLWDTYYPSNAQAMRLLKKPARELAR